MGRGHQQLRSRTEVVVYRLSRNTRSLGDITHANTLAGLARDGKTNKAGVPKNPLRLALILRHFEDEIYFVRPPLSVQRVILGALARVARLLGYRAEYPYPYARRSETSRTAA
jgi:hypothetical protein